IVRGRPVNVLPPDTNQEILHIRLEIQKQCPMLIDELQRLRRSISFQKLTKVGNGLRTQFWNEVWIGDTQLRVMFSRIYALEINKDCTVADKLQFSVTSSFRRSVRGGVASSQLALLQTYIEGTLLSNMEDIWV
ncbi:hypothetical protein Tco_0053441, partial [Tanacetum coccineum]